MKIIMLILLLTTIPAWAQQVKVVGDKYYDPNQCISEVAKKQDVPRSILVAILVYERHPDFDLLKDEEKFTQICYKVHFVGAILSSYMAQGMTLRQAVDKFGGSNPKFTRLIMNDNRATGLRIEH
jgi:hypothetical protein